MRLLATFLLTAALALAQLDSDTITIVSRSPATTAPPGSISVNLQVYAPVGASLDDVLAVVAPVGVAERDLVGVDAANSAQTWRFQFTAPLSALKDTLAKLTAAGSTRPRMSVSYSVFSADTSPAPDCAYPTLISQARRYAENVATAAGVRVGRIVALADAPAAGAARIGDFSQSVNGISGTFFFSSFLLGQPAPVFQPTCGVTVQFQLLR